MPRLALRRPTALLALAGMLAVSAAFIGAQGPALKPTPLDEATAQIVAAVLKQGHLSKPEINDEISKKWIRNYLEMLDPLKYYFLRADIDEFLKSETKLDDMIEQGDLSFAKQVFDRFLARSDERLEDAKAILKDVPDFTVDESIVDDPKRLD